MNIACIHDCVLYYKKRFKNKFVKYFDMNLFIANKIIFILKLRSLY